jgi:hypothetical protein
VIDVVRKDDVIPAFQSRTVNNFPFEVIMSFRFWPALAAMSLYSFAVSAQEARSSPLAGPPAAGTGYQSAFATYQPYADEILSPDSYWLQANDHVGNRGQPSRSMKAMEVDPATSRHDMSLHQHHAMPMKGEMRGAHVAD